jgi:hypothetical protein
MSAIWPVSGGYPPIEDKYYFINNASSLKLFSKFDTNIDSSHQYQLLLVKSYITSGATTSGIVEISFDNCEVYRHQLEDNYIAIVSSSINPREQTIHFYNPIDKTAVNVTGYLVIKLVPN